MSEWAVAFGLGLKLTRGHFGARDGKPRDPSGPAVGPDGILLRGDAEVVDLNTAVRAAVASEAKPMEVANA